MHTNSSFPTPVLAPSLSWGSTNSNALTAFSSLSSCSSYTTNLSPTISVSDDPVILSPYILLDILKFDTIIMLNMLDNTFSAYIFLLNIWICTSQPSLYSPQHPASSQTANICWMKQTKKTQHRINPRIRKTFRYHTDQFLTQSFQLSTSSSRDDYLSLNNVHNRELTTTQDTYFQEVLNIRKLFLVRNTRNLA